MELPSTKQQQKEEIKIKENAQDLAALKLMGIDATDGDFNKTVKQIRQNTLKALKEDIPKLPSTNKAPSFKGKSRSF